MPSLRRRVAWKAGLTVAVLATVAVVWDINRAPEAQWLARVYLGAVGLYQTHGHGLTDGWIVCRYTPTCSRYSAEAVRRFGLGRGLVLTVRRISSCQASVPAGTPDPVPPR